MLTFLVVSAFASAIGIPLPESRNSLYFHQSRNLREKRGEEKFWPHERKFLPRKEKRFPQEEKFLLQKEKRLPQEERRFPEEEKPFPQEERRLPHEEKRFPHEEKPFPEEEKPFPQEERRLPHEEKRFPHEEKPFPEEEKRLLQEEKRLPQAIVIGVKKAGTRALLEYLRLHPDVRSPGPEVHFFDRHFERGLDWYRRQMPPTLPDQLTIEKTPSYFVTKDVSKRVAEILPQFPQENLKFLVVLRNPVDRALSDYAQASSKRPNMNSFENMAFINYDPEILNMTGDLIINDRWAAIRIGVYIRYLRKWLRFFPLEKFHFVSGENLIQNPAAEMQKVQEFLQLSPKISERNFVLDSEKGFPCLKNSVNSKIPDTEIPDTEVPHCLGKTKGREHPKISEKIRKKLAEFFQPFNEELFELIGKRFDWN